MDRRKTLHQILSDIMADVCEDDEVRVYFQPPETIKLNYPCIIYERDSATTRFADNAPYVHTLRYQVTVIDRNPDSTIPGKVAMLPMCIYDRHFVSDNLHHDVYKIYF